MKRYRLKLKFTSLQDEDLTCKLGNESGMLNKLAGKLGKSNQEMLTIIIEA